MQKLKLLWSSFAFAALILSSVVLVPNFAQARQGSDTSIDDDSDQDKVEDADKEENEEGQEIDDQDGLADHKPCVNTLVNGHLYKTGTEATVYMSSHCILKPFRGQAVFHSRGLKFENITIFETLPIGVTMSDKPMLPADGTLVKGQDKTVWFVDNNGHRRGFVTEDVFKKLGFTFDKVQDISETDLAEIPTDTNVVDELHHPDGSLIKCGTSADVFIVIGAKKFPFANADAFKSRGHSFEHILQVDCGRFSYPASTTIK